MKPIDRVIEASADGNACLFRHYLKRGSFAELGIRRRGDWPAAQRLAVEFLSGSVVGCVIDITSLALNGPSIVYNSLFKAPVGASLPANIAGLTVRSIREQAGSYPSAGGWPCPLITQLSISDTLGRVSTACVFERVRP